MLVDSLRNLHWNYNCCIKEKKLNSTATRFYNVKQIISEKLSFSNAFSCLWLLLMEKQAFF